MDRRCGIVATLTQSWVRRSKFVFVSALMLVLKIWSILTVMGYGGRPSKSCQVRTMFLSCLQADADDFRSGKENQEHR